MKKILIVFICLLFPILSFADDNKKKDVVISVNISKISRTLGKVISFVGSEVDQFAEEISENISEDTKERAKYEFRYTLDAIHQGVVTGLRGEEYTPPYEHKKFPERQYDPNIEKGPIMTFLDSLFTVSQVQ